jgi:hypothetical protein
MSQLAEILVSNRSRPTAAELRRCLSYDKESGLLTWIAQPSPKSRCAIGAEAGYTEPDGYRRIKFLGRLYGAHVLAWVIVAGEWPELEIDHQDVNPSNNRWANLREATRSQNKANMPPPATNTSGVKGVHWDAERGKWAAAIRVNGRKRLLGRYSEKQDAAGAYQTAALQHFGEFARFA